MSKPDETLRDQLLTIIRYPNDKMPPRQSIAEGIRKKQVDQILQLFRTTLEDCLPEKQPLARLVDGDYVGLETLGELDNEMAYWRVGFNQAIAATREAFARVVG